MEKLNDLHGKVVMVTAGTGGIGKVTATELAKLGARVVVIGRDAHRGRTALDDIRARSGNPNVDLMLPDLSSQAEVAQLARQFSARYDELHVLVNNIGRVQARRTETVDGIETTFAITYLNVFLLTSLLLPLLKVSSPSRIVNVNSSAHRWAQLNFDDLQSRQRYQPPGAYSRAKLAPIARVLSSTPTIENAAWSSVYLAASPDVEGVTGQYFSPRATPVKSSKASYDLEAARQLWKVSEALVALHLKTEPMAA